MEIDDESLVAFLDGELPAGEAARIQAAAADDKSVQQRIDELNRSWALLDDLPNENLNADVAQSTLEMVSLAIVDDEKEAKKWRQVTWLASFAIFALTATLAGWGLSKAIGYAREQSQLSGLNVVVASERFSLLPSSDFLELLTDIELLTADANPNRKTDVFANGELFQLKTNIQRKEWIEELSPTDKQELARKYERFSNLPTDRRLQTKEIASYVLDQGDRRGELFQAANAYLRLAQNRQFDLAMQDAIRAGDESLQRELIAEELAYIYRLSDADRDTILQWSEEWAADTRLEYAFQDTGLNLNLNLDDLVWLNLGLPAERSNITPTDIEWLVDDLEGYSHDLLLALPATLKRDVLSKWYADAIEATAEAAGEARLRERYEELSRPQRSELLLLPFDVAREQLAKPRSKPSSESPQ